MCIFLSYLSNCHSNFISFIFSIRYFCHDGCCFGCCSGGGEFIDEPDGGGCQELSVIDRLREKADREGEDDDDGEEGLASRVTTALLTPISMVRNRKKHFRSESFG